MAQSGELATSGMLYGASLDEWKERTMATLRIPGLNIYVQEQAALTPTVAAKEMWQEKSSMVAAFISILVTPDISLRVPACEPSNAKMLMQRLTARCEHFRFLDLPAKLRNRICGFVLMGGDQGDCYPTITKVSHQTREEVLHAFYASTAFIFDAGDKGFEAHL